MIGFDESAGTKLRAFLENGDIFVAEQVSVPALCERHWMECGDGPNDLDHAFHEFICIRPADEEELKSLSPEADLATFIERFREAAGSWNVLLSPNSSL
ncbi:hypothetical protein AAD027_02205 [Pseudoxanthomonas putridarboris]|uniref:Uncharacterized protein n=1 Tax=Pseudoxanthomonas putridarboris TaxID=752605 RepID=A0ABU9IX01_9GAMM